MDLPLGFQDAYAPANLRFLAEGLLVTLGVSVLAIAFSFVLGCLVGIVRYARVPVAARLLGIGVELIRNLPLLLLIFFTRFALPEIGIRMSVFWCAVTALTVFEAAMISEIVRGGLRSVDKGQIEAARASGLTYTQCLRHIILPQALRRMVPPTVSQFISLIKDTSLAVIISLPELMHHAKILTGVRYDFVIPVLLAVAVMYFAVNYLLSLVAKKLETREPERA
ncbi:glutamine ABC transporter permease [Paenibacillus sp. J31TS4]|uniref:amino acid ABC transporter permease n=1 Tax=Paenibacillus sp. J31TS4 TaxID=2807195 RepID=UPI001B20F18F|nr:amino acid ABC transporter permease [Paenibacillus sp. J31TS4]GIP40891.1 glutamine ABC transporter permease [Paenibacillus sp. J31TS4]